MICDSWQSAYLQLSNLIVSLMQLNLGEASVQPVHLFRVRHGMNSQGSLELLVLLFIWVRVFSELVMVVLESLQRRQTKSALHETWWHDRSTPNAVPGLVVTERYFLSNISCQLDSVSGSSPRESLLSELKLHSDAKKNPKKQTFAAGLATVFALWQIHRNVKIKQKTWLTT